VLDHVVLWDFDGTLAERPGLWSGCMLEVLDESLPGHGITRDQLRVRLRDGFPWHRHEIAHPELCEAEAWWDEIGVLIHRSMAAVGIAEERARELVPAVRSRFIDPTRGWRLFEDTLPALRATRAGGWSNVVLSNHVPELPVLVTGLGLDDELDAVFTSALMGYEKPHPEAFRHALRECGNPTAVWMVGDNPDADVAGAEAIGLRAVHVRTASESRHRFDDLAGAVELILAS
jgi:putative hydrolase of the HAD superfamily